MLKIESVYKTFNKNTPQANMALNNISLHVLKGQFVCVVGGNGSGKSTLINTICGSIAQDSGSILVDNVNISKLPEHKRASVLGHVFQNPLKGSAPNMSIEENLSLALMRGRKRSLRAGTKRQDAQTLKDAVAMLGLGLEDKMQHKMGLLSGGQRQAITLLMATFNNPKLLLLDEHTAALDPKTAKQVMSITDELINTNKMTTLMVTHNMRDAMKYGDRLVMMAHGQIVQDIPSQEKPKLTMAKMLSMFDEDLSAII